MFLGISSDGFRGTCEEAIFREETQDIICKIVKMVDETKQLIEVESGYVREYGEVTLLRKKA
ncbi:MAG: hypothetical protein V1915_00530 [Candidatus Bathyarchaeota archaeon]